VKRIAVAGFQHETNTFAPGLATFAEFEEADAWPGLLKNDEVLTQLAGLKVSLTGFTDAASAKGGYAIIPVLWCAAEPSSYVSNDAFERIAGQIVQGIRDAGDLDGIYLELHGAMVTQTFEDGEGELLSRIRALTGPDLPIVVSFDYHANVTPEIVEHASCINIFRTYPHIDLVETGARSFVAMERCQLKKEIHYSFPPDWCIWKDKVPSLCAVKLMALEMAPAGTLYTMVQASAIAPSPQMIWPRSQLNLYADRYERC